MAKVQKPCKICGKMFTPCADCERDKTMFHWRTVACSLECAKVYFAKVEAARNHVDNTEIKNEETKSEETENIVLEEYEHAAGKRWKIYCCNCMSGIDRGYDQSPHGLIDAWNKRV